MSWILNGPWIFLKLVTLRKYHFIVFFQSMCIPNAFWTFVGEKYNTNQPYKADIKLFNLFIILFFHKRKWSVVVVS